jgi:hypothetical protein
MAACPRCQRPVAVARATCLYCGAALPSAALPLPPEPDEAPLPEATRALLILDLARAEPARLCAAFGLTELEAGQWTRRGGYQLRGLLEPEDAEKEAERLSGLGLAALVLPEEEMRAALRPVVASGGRPRGEGIELDTPRGALHVARGALLLVVEGPITREYQTDQEVRRVRTATLEPGYRFHLHRLDVPRPLELDPGTFDFGGGDGASVPTLLALRDWMAALGAPVDDAFRRAIPALGAAAPGPRGPLSAAEALRARQPPEGRALILDNLPQFHFYSAWRGAVERRRRS